MKKHNFFKRTVCIAAAAAALFTSAAIPFPAAAAEDDATETIDVSTLPDHIQNGDFEAPTVETFVSSTSNPNKSWFDHSIGASHADPPDPDDIIFRKNDAWLVTSKNNFDGASNNRFYWDTTATDHRIELGTTNIGTTTTGRDHLISYWNGFAPDTAEITSDVTGAGSGRQFAELVAEEQASLYQNIKTEPGSTLTWSLMHRARYNTETEGKDTMALFIGPMQAGSLTKTDKDGKDLFMYMADLLNLDYDELNTGMSQVRRTLYSKPITEDTTSIDSTFVSTNGVGEYTEEWTCWIITDDYMDWETYADSYTVPEGQKATTFAFTSLTGAAVGIDGSTTHNQGNCLDNIQFGVLYPLTVTATEGGSGTVSYTVDDVASNINVDNDNSYLQYHEDDTSVIITADANNNYTFIGAMVDGEYVSADEFDRGYTLIMDRQHVVRLLFSRNGYVIYDPNGGTLNDQTDYMFSYFDRSETMTMTPTNGNSQFLGWLVVDKDGIQNKHLESGEYELVPSAHTIDYTAGGWTWVEDDSWPFYGHYEEIPASFTITYDSGKTLELDPNENNTVFLIAQYRYSASAQACTRNIGDAVYTEPSDAGGEVTIENLTTTTPGTGDAKKSVFLSSGDSFRVTATPKPGFRVERLYYRNAVTGELSPISTYTVENGVYTYKDTYTFDTNAEIHAHFVEDRIAPYLSMVPENDDALNALTPEGLVHGVSGNDTDGYLGGYGGEQYGNTISTGFFTERSFADENSSVLINGTWTIYIPANGTYFKITDTNLDDYKNIDNDDPVVTDSPEVANNQGAIYRAESSTANYNRQVKVHVDDNVTITGSGAVVFGIVVDDLYAPNAYAGFKLGVTEGIDLDNNNSVIADEEHEYNQSDFDAIGSTSNTDTQQID